MSLRAPGKRAIQAAVDDFTPFKGNSISGTKVSENGYVSYGRLPEPFRKALLHGTLNGSVDFVIYSYATPIAWHACGGWIAPPVEYSKTTTQHQNVIKTAIANKDFYKDAKW